MDRSHEGPKNVIGNLAEHHGAARRNPRAETDRASRILSEARTMAAGPRTLATERDELRVLGEALEPFVIMLFNVLGGICSGARQSLRRPTRKPRPP